MENIITGRIITEELLEGFRNYLVREEKSRETVNKYIRDARKLGAYACGREITKELVVDYKRELLEGGKYMLSSINSFLIAANRLFEYAGWTDLRIKTFRMQKEVFTPADTSLSKREYKKLISAALRMGKKRLAMILRTLCSMGIRISELMYITVEGVKNGVVDIYCKGKHRKVAIPGQLAGLLLGYIEENNITGGMVFRTSTGGAVDRSNIWREMKALGEEAGVSRKKIFPHNLRHLFAKVFYSIDKDIAKLADILGHSSMETTRAYIKTTYEEHRKQMDMMGLV